MRTLVEKVAGLLPELEERGAVYLFAMGERETVGKWEVILSSDWSDADEIIAVKTVADALVKRLQPAELVLLAGVMIIPSNEPHISEMPRSLENASPDEPKIVDVPLPDIGRMFIFKARSSQQALRTSQLRPDEASTAVPS